MLYEQTPAAGVRHDGGQRRRIDDDHPTRPRQCCQGEIESIGQIVPRVLRDIEHRMAIQEVKYECAV